MGVRKAHDPKGSMEVHGTWLFAVDRLIQGKLRADSYKAVSVNQGSFLKFVGVLTIRLPMFGVVVRASHFGTRRNFMKGPKYGVNDKTGT